LEEADRDNIEMLMKTITDETRILNNKKIESYQIITQIEIGTDNDISKRNQSADFNPTLN
jgi:hypothetical protein